MTVALFAVLSQAPLTPYVDRPEVTAFIARMARQHGFHAEALTEMLRPIERQQSVLEKITKPAEAKDWATYRAIFLTPERIGAGVEFEARHRELIAAVSAAYAVDAAVILGILGVETRYGAKRGGHKVLEALVTLAFDYPRRAKFFTQELEQYLLLCRESAFDPRTLEGSYAGAMGLGQFMPSSYRAFAVDHDQDGRKDLWSAPDAVASIANYLKRHGWKAGAPVAIAADGVGGRHAALANNGFKASLALAEIERAGVKPRVAIAPEQRVSLHALPGATGTELWIGLHNFWVITRYNASSLYALAVHQLGQEVVAASKGVP